MKEGVEVRTRRALRNVLASFAGHVSEKFFSLLWTAVSARFLGPAGFGVFSWAVAFWSLMAVLVEGGFTPLTIREVARQRQLGPGYFSNLLSLRTLLAFPVGLLGWALLRFWRNLPPEHYQVAFWVGMGILWARSWSSTCHALLNAHERMDLDAWGRGVGRLALLVGGGAALLLGYGLKGVAVAFAVATFLEAGLRFALVKPLVGLRFPFDGNTCWEITRASWPFALAFWVSQSEFYIDVPLLAYFKGEEAVGFYTAGTKLVFHLMTLALAYNMAIYPMLSRFFQEEGSSVARVFAQSLKFSVVVGVPLVALFMVWSPWVIQAFYGSEFSASVAVLRVLLGALLILTLQAVTTTTLQAVNQQKVCLWAQVLGLVLNLGLGLWWMPRFSFMGAAYARVVSELAILIWQMRALRRHLPFLDLRDTCWKPLLAGVIVVPLIGWGRFSLGTAFLNTLGICLGYGLLLVGTKAFSSQDRYLAQVVLEQLKRRKTP